MKRYKFLVKKKKRRSWNIYFNYTHFWYEYSYIDNKPSPTQYKSNLILNFVKVVFLLCASHNITGKQYHNVVS